MRKLSSFNLPAGCFLIHTMNSTDGEYLGGRIFHRTSAPICRSNTLYSNYKLMIISYQKKSYHFLSGYFDFGTFNHCGK